MTGHFYSPAVLLISEMTWRKLSPDQQKIIADAAIQARDYERELSLKADQELEAACKKEGMIITHPDKAPFVKAVAPVYSNPSVVKAIGGGNAKEGQKLIDAALAAAK
jgi:TRAP-type C4-dicarboxylate transport system substrate-binding protein